MSFSSIASMLEAAKSADKPLYTIICEDDCQENNYTEEASHRQIQTLWEAMQQSSKQYCASDRSNSGFIGGDTEEKQLDTEVILQALYIAAGFGQVTAIRANVAGAEGGCQAEIGTASAMAAAALTHILGGTAEQCAHAFAMSLGNLLGLICDPVAGLVEIPCVKRNVVGAVNAVSAANMALAGITSHIPADEVIDTMGEVGDTLPASLRETGLGGLAATPTGKKITEQVLHHEQLL